MLEKILKSPYLFNVVLVVLVSLLLGIPFLNQLNNIFLDRLQGSIELREEIIIIGIDDKSLNEIGAWPWTRDVFADFITKLNETDPKLAAMDILFFEPREGDDEFQNAISESGFPIVLGSKVVEGELLTSIFSDDNVFPGYVNFVPDADGKIRESTIAASLQGDCEESFSFAAYRNAIDNALPLNCADSIKVSDEESFDRTVLFSYSKEDFEYFSFADIYFDRVDLSKLNDKNINGWCNTN